MVARTRGFGGNVNRRPRRVPGISTRGRHLDVPRFTSAVTINPSANASGDSVRRQFTLWWHPIRPACSPLYGPRRCHTVSVFWQGVSIGVPHRGPHDAFTLAFMWIRTRDQWTARQSFGCRTLEKTDFFEGSRNHPKFRRSDPLCSENPDQLSVTSGDEFFITNSRKIMIFSHDDVGEHSC